MEQYRNLSGRSGVNFFEIGMDFIRVQFSNDPAVYVYDYEKPGSDEVEEMKILALSGNGLSTYIATQIRDNYSRIER